MELDVDKPAHVSFTVPVPFVMPLPIAQVQLTLPVESTLFVPSPNAVTGAPAAVVKVKLQVAYGGAVAWTVALEPRFTGEVTDMIDMRAEVVDVALDGVALGRTVGCGVAVSSGAGRSGVGVSWGSKVEDGNGIEVGVGVCVAVAVADPSVLVGVGTGEEALRVASGVEALSFDPGVHASNRTAGSSSTISA